MNEVVRLAIVDPNDATRALLKNMLLGIDSVWLEAECSRYEFFTDVATQTKPDIAWVATPIFTNAATRDDSTHWQRHQAGIR